LYLAYQTWDLYSIKNETWDECNTIANQEDSPEFSLTDELTFLEWYMSAQDYPGCLENYTNVWILAKINLLLTIVSILLVILSWRFDLSKKKA